MSDTRATALTPSLLSLHPRLRRWCGSGLWLGIALLASLQVLSTEFATASELDGIAEASLSVVFEPDSMICEPYAKQGSLYVRTATREIAYYFGTPVSGIHPIIRRGTPNHKIEGPWQVLLLAAVDADSLAGVLSGQPLVRSASSDILLADPGDPGPVTGESAATWFPPGPDASHPERNVRFCDSQPYLHHRHVGDHRFPDEWCNWETVGANDYDMDLPQAWSITRGDTNVVIAVIDTGYDWIHPDLGGPGPLTAVQDSIVHYNGGVTYRNWGESIGDASNDGRPGLAGIDDDDDGLVDEDSRGREPSNSPESELIVGECTTAGTFTLTDGNANWSSGSLVGMYVYTDPLGRNNAFCERIAANTQTSLTVVSNGPIGALAAKAPIGLVDFCPPGTRFKIGNALDDDGDTHVDDMGYLDDLALDDDENGFIDDIRGWDWVDLPYLVGSSSACATGDYEIEDNDPRSAWGHGTGVASTAASSSNHGKVLGVAPGVRILPSRNGMVLACNGCGTEKSRELVNYTGAIDYAAMMGADIIVTSRSDGALTGEIDALQRAVDSGIIYVQGAGNSGQENINVWSSVEPSVIVAGLTRENLKDPSSTYSSAVDVAADWHVYQATPNLICSDPSEQHSHTDWGGTSVSGPLAAGVLALMKSAYPDWARDQLISKLKASTVDISSLNPGYVGKLGTGKINAYRSLTLYGSQWTSADTTWAGELWVSGDITVPEGATLTIAPGTVVHIAQDDILSAGTDPFGIQFNIRGEIIVGEEGGFPVVFSSFTDADSTWGPLVLNSGSVTSRGLFHNVQFQDMGVVARKEELALAQRVSLQFYGCTFSARDDGIALQGLGGATR